MYECSNVWDFCPGTCIICRFSFPETTEGLMVFTCHVEPKSCTVSSQSLYCHDCYKVEIDVCSKCTRALTLLSLLPRLMDPLVWSIAPKQLSLSHTQTHRRKWRNGTLRSAWNVWPAEKLAGTFFFRIDNILGMYVYIYIYRVWGWEICIYIYTYIGFRVEAEICIYIYIYIYRV